MSRSVPLRLAFAPVLLAGCSALDREPGGASVLRPVSIGESARPAPATSDDDADPMTAWADRQRFVFSRAWQEIRQDMAYESIDSFGALGEQARGETVAMRRDLDAARRETARDRRDGEGGRE